MPLYDYSCRRCGPFRAWRKMSQSDRAAACPRCRQPSRRALAAPSLNLMAGSTRSAHARNERSAHEPAIVRREAANASPHDHHHGGIGRKAAAHKHKHRSHHPWMVGHSH